MEITVLNIRLYAVQYDGSVQIIFEEVNIPGYSVMDLCEYGQLTRLPSDKYALVISKDKSFRLECYSNNCFRLMFSTKCVTTKRATLQDSDEIV